jgi:hypothetical protein
MTDPTLSSLLSEYVQARDNFVQRERDSQGGAFFRTNGQTRFVELITSYANRFAREMPPHMSLAQWEALAELANSYLSLMRQERTQS